MGLVFLTCNTTTRKHNPLDWREAQISERGELHDLTSFFRLSFVLVDVKQATKQIGMKPYNSIPRLSTRGPPPNGFGSRPVAGLRRSVNETFSAFVSSATQTKVAVCCRRHQFGPRYLHRDDISALFWYFSTVRSICQFCLRVEGEVRKQDTRGFFSV